MKRFGFLLSVSALLAFGLVAVSAGAAEVPRQVPAAAKRATAPAAGQRAAVDRLQQHVASLEQKNSEAHARLQKQDQDIAELQRQLQALHGSSAPQH
jgi:uncharacterized protein HemX